MNRPLGLPQRSPQRQRLAVVLGTNEIASAIAVYLRKSGWAVILSYDPLPPVMRRGMAFHDALFGDPAHLEGISAQRVDFITEAFPVFAREDRVAITWLGVTELLVLGSIDALIDARMQKYAATPDLRGLAKIAVGLGPGFFVHGNCDIAIETKPGTQGAILVQGVTEPADGRSIRLGDAGEERFVRADIEGRWRTSLEIGVRVYKGVVVGHHEGDPVRHRSTAFCAGLCVTVPRCRRVPSFSKSIRVADAPPNGPESTSGPGKSPPRCGELLKSMKTSMVSCGMHRFINE